VRVTLLRARAALAAAATSLWRHRLRSSLTMLGMVFGVGAVVAMLAVGRGEAEEAQARYGRLGVRNLVLESVRPVGAGASGAWAVEYGLTRQDVAAVAATVPGLSRVVARREVAVEARNGGRRVPAVLAGVDPDWPEVAGLSVERGRWLSPADDGNVCVLGAGLAESLFVGESALGATLRLGGDAYRVVGVAAPSADEDATAFVPLPAALSRLGGLLVTPGSGQVTRERVEVHRAVAQARTAQDVPSAAAALRRLLRTRHPSGDAVLVVPLELLEQAAAARRDGAIVLGSIAAISLLVGGIGIMNIMLASVTERTREIGVRRALGASRRAVVRQFLAESLLLSGVGGAVGCLLGVALPALVTGLFSIRTEVTPGALALALGVSAAVGVAFGLYPAVRAARLDPVEALRHG
jgi:putative ABC transport system permease protein